MNEVGTVTLDHRNLMIVVFMCLKDEHEKDLHSHCAERVIYTRAEEIQLNQWVEVIGREICVHERKMLP